MKIDRLLVATDFSECANTAAEVGMALAERFGAKLYWVHALQPPYPVFAPYAVAIPADIGPAARRAANEKLCALQDAAQARGIAGTIHIGETPASLAIADRANEIDADCIVVGTRGHTGLDHVLVGSVAERTVKHSDRTVLTIKDDRAAAPKSIVVGVDFSEHCEAAIDIAAEMARTFGARLTLVNAVDLPIPLVTAYEVSIPDRAIEECHEAARRMLSERASQLEGVTDVKIETVSRPASVALVEAAEAANADLIVTGSRGLHGVKHAVLGSVAERTLRHAPCSVLTVKSS